VRRREWSAPAEVDPADTAEYPDMVCDCYWHRRVFSHVRLGPPGVPNTHRLPLAREVVRTDYEDRHDRICWDMTLKMEGLVIEVRRLIHPALHGDRLPRFSAIAGDPRGLPGKPGGAVRLQPANDHRRRDREGGDPVVLWHLPERIGSARFPADSALIVWAEAWWWHLNDDGRDALTALSQLSPVESSISLPPWGEESA
jgi:hypothetical protein